MAGRLRFGVVIAAIAAALLAAGVGLRLAGSAPAVGPGVSSAVGDQVLRDFASDEAREDDALVQDRVDLVNGSLGGSALVEFQRRLVGMSGPVQEVRTDTTTTVLGQPDPGNPSLSTEVHQTGTLRRTFGGNGSEPARTEDVAFDGHYWMAKLGGRYAIFDAAVTEAPQAAAAPPWALLGAGTVLVVTVGIIGGLKLPRPVTVERLEGWPEVADQPSMPEVAAQPVDAESAPGLVVETVGRLHLWYEGIDHAPELLGREIVGFFWLYLLVRRVAGLGPATRLELGDEAYHGVAMRSLRKRVTDRLSDLRRALPAPLVEVVKDRGQLVWLDLPDSAIDVVRLRGLRADLSQSGAGLSGPMLAHVERELAQSKGLFLPVWEEVQRMTAGRGSAIEVVESVRREVRVCRAELLGRVGEAYLERGDAHAAVTALSEALGAAPEREAIAALLSRALLASGEPSRAEALKREYGTGAS